MFSRVILEKDVQDTMRVIRRINENDNEVQVKLDIYGSIDSNYKE